MSNVRIVRGLHELNRGGNGSRWFGITVRTNEPDEVTKRRDYAYQVEWDMNHWTLRKGRGDKYVAAYLGLTREEHDALLDEMEKMIKDNPATIKSV